ncbi:hypothetical protein FQA39_LY02629 [Lamprigera yunnana]|nr:hypothetical protein FQA39_LY02629 [Lamprigera yunnana]
MNYEKEQDRLQRLMEECLNSDSNLETEFEDDEEQNEEDIENSEILDTETEQEISDDESNNQRRQIESLEERGASVGSVKSAFTICWLPLHLLTFPMYNLPLAQVIIDAVNKDDLLKGSAYNIRRNCINVQAVSSVELEDLLRGIAIRNFEIQRDQVHYKRITSGHVECNIGWNGSSGMNFTRNKKESERTERAKYKLIYKRLTQAKGGVSLLIKRSYRNKIEDCPNKLQRATNIRLRLKQKKPNTVV